MFWGLLASIAIWASLHNSSGFLTHPSSSVSPENAWQENSVFVSVLPSRADSSRTFSTFQGDLTTGCTSLHRWPPVSVFCGILAPWGKDPPQKALCSSPFFFNETGSYGWNPFWIPHCSCRPFPARHTLLLRLPWVWCTPGWKHSGFYCKKWYMYKHRLFCCELVPHLELCMQSQNLGLHSRKIDQVYL